MIALVEFLGSIWQLFEQTTVPGFSISFAQLWLGAFVIGVSIMILRPLLGIGAGFSNIIGGVGRRVVNHQRRPRLEYEEEWYK